MVLPEMSSPQGRSASVPDQSTSGGVFPFEPSNSQGASSSQQSNDNPQPTSAHAGAQASGSHKNDGNQSKSVLGDTWDGLIIEKPTSFSLSEIVDLRPMHYSDHLYAYTRANGRSGFIMDSLLEDILMEKGVISASKPEPNAEGKKSKEKGKGKVKKQDGPRATTAQDVAAATGSAKASDTEAETAFASQTFEKVCDDLQTFIELLDTSRYDEDGKHQTKVCIDAIKAVSERAKELGKQPLKARVAAPSAVDPETHCAVPRPPPWKGELCGRQLPCVAHSNREYIPDNPQLDTRAANVHKEAGIIEAAVQEEKPREAPKRLSIRGREAASENVSNGGQKRLTYSQAARAAARYYATTSAYGRPLENATEGVDSVDVSEKEPGPGHPSSHGEDT